jgi:nucleoside-diphosphate-sugar epimerase
MAAIALAVEQNLQLAVLRPFHVFGEGEGPDRLWPSLHKAALSGEDFPMTAGGQIRDFIPVEQVAQAFLRALDLPSEAFHFSPSTFASTTPVVANIGTGRPQTILEFAEHWWKEWGATGKLLPGAIPCRPNEVMRYVPEVSPPFLP